MKDRSIFCITTIAPVLYSVRAYAFPPICLQILGGITFNINKMTKIKVYLHEENKRDPREIEIAENATVQELIESVSTNGDAKSIELFIDEEAGPLQRDDLLTKSGVIPKTHIHCHRCKRIDLTVSYNGQSFKHGAQPSLSINRIKKRAGEKFSISISDLADLVLKLDSGETLQGNDHIGTLVAFPDCSLHLNLLPENPIQG
ncbi:MAG: hypothetical protein ABI729_03410 [Chitinophagales bacterium]